MVLCWAAAGAGADALREGVDGGATVANGGSAATAARTRTQPSAHLGEYTYHAVLYN